MISDLPTDVAEDVLSRLPVTSLVGVRFACKKWNTLTKDEGFIKKHLGKNQWRKVVMLLDYKVYLMNVDLLTPSSLERIGLPPYTVKIWISSSKIEPDAVSWNKLFLSVDMKPLTGFLFLDNGGSFFVDEDEEVAVVLDKARGKFRLTHNIACIIGKNGHFKQVDLGERADPSLKLPTNIPVVCSYVPSSVDIM
ncbi:unnamed protein product [Brassica napus]|uniref:(rape) hypothetical protein n=1 Tax=Brassica napus TaxID=3708 RepID=A0A816L9U2_BRANA|nr:unnamed protein product [Brassica napus]